MSKHKEFLCAFGRLGLSQYWAMVCRQTLCVAAWITLALAVPMTVSAPAYGQAADWRTDMKAAAKDYAEARIHEEIESQKKAAVIALYKRLYKSGANKKLSGALARTVLSAEKLDQLAQTAADALSSPDPKKVQEATETLAVSLGHAMADLAKTPAGRKHVEAILSKAGTVKEVSQLLGGAGTARGKRAIAKYLGETLIDATPAAAVVGFYKSAYGVMKYANDKFTSSEVEELYQAYKKGGNKAVKRKLDNEHYGWVLNSRMSELRAKRAAGIEDSSYAAPPKLIAHLTNVSQKDVEKELLGTFKNRREKERRETEEKKKETEYSGEYNTIVKQLQWVSESRFGRDWKDKVPDFPAKKFIDWVHKALADDILDPKRDLKAMAHFAAIKLLYGEKSAEYKEELAKLDEIRREIIKANMGAKCAGQSPKVALRLRNLGFAQRNAGNTEQARTLLRMSLKVCELGGVAVALAALERRPQSSIKDGAYIGQSKNCQGKQIRGTGQNFVFDSDKADECAPSGTRAQPSQLKLPGKQLQRSNQASVQPTVKWPTLAGKWLSWDPRVGTKGVPCTLAQNGKTLSFLNNFNQRSRGNFITQNTIIATDWEGGLRGTVVGGGSRINWANGSYWVKARSH